MLAVNAAFAWLAFALGARGVVLDVVVAWIACAAVFAIGLVLRWWP